MSNQAPQPPQTSHSPYYCGPTSYPTPGPRPETLHCPRNSSPHLIVDTHLVPPGVPFEIPCPICHGAIERGECHHHGERNIVWSSSSNLRAHQNPFTIFQVLRSLSFSSLGSYFQAPYGLETSPHHSSPSLSIPTPPFISSIVQNVQHSIARSVPRPETARGLLQSSRGSHHSWKLAQHPCTRSNASSLSNTSTWRDNWVQVEYSTSPSSGTNSATRDSTTCWPHPTYPIKSLRLLQDYLEWDQDEDEDDLNLYKRLDLIKESWHADSLVEINLWINNFPEYNYIPQNGWLPHLTVKFLMPHKPIASHLLSTCMAEVEVLPQCYHLIRISQLYKLLQMPIHCPLPGYKYPCQVTPFTIQTTESGATFTVNGLCYFDETISQCYEGAGWAFPSSSYKSTWSFHIHGQGFKIFHPDLSPPNFANVFLMKSFISNVN